MAALNRPTEATYEIHEFASVDTRDNEDHTFCGIMFPVKCKDLLPIDHLVIKSVAVRGCLGPMTVWVSNRGQHQRRSGSGAPSVQERIHLDPKYWTKLYEKTHRASRYTYKELELTSPIRLHPGETRVIYIHSTLPGDEAIVYDNTHYGESAKRYEDDKIAILSGRAHVSNEVFGQEPIWGWGNAWRDRREFVGRLNYGTVYKLWNPQVQPKFGDNFQDGARALFLCQRRWESPWSMLPDECIFYILNMCRWDWFDDDANSMRQRRKREKKRREEQELRQQEKRALEAMAVGEAEDEEKPAASCHRRCKKARAQAIVDDDDDDGDDNVGVDDDDEEYAEEDAKVSAVNGVDDEMEEIEDSDDADFVDDEDEEWSDDEDQYHRANIEAFTYNDIDSDDEDTNEREAAAADRTRREWIRQQFARIHVRWALGMEGDHGAAAFLG